MDVQLARLKLPLPLEPAIRRALAQRDRSARHEGLVLAWELAVRILAGTLWANCRQVGAESRALRSVMAKLERPSLGVWVEFVRTSSALLRERQDQLLEPLRGTLDGLQSTLPREGGLRALQQRIEQIPDAPPRAQSVQQLVDLLPFYRNAAQSTHQQVALEFREASVEALLAALLEFCERVPLCGEYSLVLVGRMERAGEAGAVEIARLHGTNLTWDRIVISSDAWASLQSSRIHLLREPAQFVPLFPMAAVSTRGSEWQIGWYARRVHSPTVAYQGLGGVDFQVALAPEELAVLAPEKEAASGAAAPRTDLDPYRGLLVYDEAHAAIFLGREEETDAALARLADRGALFVYGASGSGKSSWLRAGILPALRTQAALTGRTLLPIVCVPGAEPAPALERALILARGGSTKQALLWKRTVEQALHGERRSLAEGVVALLRALSNEGLLPVLLVDQLEEAALVADPLARQAFLDVVAHATRAARSAGFLVLTSVRADRLGPLLEHAGVRACVQDEGWALGSIPHERLGRVISEPPRQRSVRVQEGLPEMILSDVGSEPGTLALLSQVLATLWSERARYGGVLTKQGYVDAGRVWGALELQAEAALAELASSRANLERDVDRLFRALVTSGESGRFLRRRLELERVGSALGFEADELRALAQPFVRRHLLVLSGGDGEETIEIAHERLLDGWPRLAKLLAGEREALDLRNEIERAAAAWKASGGKSELWSDATSRLRRGEELLERGVLDLDDEGRAFLVESRTAQRRRRRAERRMLLALGVLAVLAIGFGWTALLARASAIHASEESEKRGVAVRSAERKLNAVATLALVGRLTTEADRLWPVAPAGIPSYQSWIAEARRLIDGGADQPGLAVLEADLAALRSQARPRTAEQIAQDRLSSPQYELLQQERVVLGEFTQRLALAESGRPIDPELQQHLQEQQKRVRELEREVETFHPQYEFENPADQWWHEQLAAVVAAVREFADDEHGLFSNGISPTRGWGVPRRLRFALELQREQHEVGSVRRAWEQADADLAADRRYAGVHLPHFVDLLPLGKDPASGLLEFAHLPSGAPAHRAGDGTLALHEETGIVLVLVPGGTCTLGAQHSDPKGLNYDADSGGESPVHKVTLPALLVSKYEMTQGQWERSCGSNPSDYQAGHYSTSWNKNGKDASLLHPVESVSCDDCIQVLGRQALRLPSEDEWEHAARSGASTPWWSGPSERDLAGAANFADSFGKRANPSWTKWAGFVDDGNSVHGEVGSYRPNLFGLYDVHGNVWEWCTGNEDRTASERRLTARLRGGSFDDAPQDARFTASRRTPTGTRMNTIGVRPVRSLE